MNDALSVAYGGPVPGQAVHGNVLTWYEAWVKDTPAAVAIEDGPHTWTYQQLDDMAGDVAGSLGAQAGDIVGVCLDRSPALVAVAVALARVGAVYLPLGPRPGAKRLSNLLRDNRITALVGSAEVLPGIGRQHDLPVPLAGANVTGRTLVEILPPAPNAVPAPPGTLYTVLTSGSTGSPKAVAVGGAALANLVRWYHDLTGLGPGDRMSLLMAVPFDPHLGDLWSALSFGATLAVAPDEVRYATESLVAWYRDAKVDVSVLATPLAEPLLSGDWPEGLALRDLLIGGDRLRGWPRPGVTARIHNVYGPAETTVNVTAATLEPGTNRPGPPIGTPIPGVTVCVVDEQGRILERGRIGELLVGGASLAIGYLDAELTERRFVPAPQGSGVDRVYRTGDQVRMRADGVLEFVGRIDDQVKISGVRIEPSEVEAALELDPRVERAVVAVRRLAADRFALVAFVQCLAGQRPDAAALLAGARATLPEQAVPASVHLVDDFPLNENGKVDRAALLAGVPAEHVEELSGDTPVRLAALWKDVLGVEDVHAGSNFLELGGNSMHAFALAGAIKNTFDVDLSMRTVMGLRVLRELSSAIDAERSRIVESDRQPAGATEW